MKNGRSSLSKWFCLRGFTCKKRTRIRTLRLTYMMAQMMLYDVMGSSSYTL